MKRIKSALSSRTSSASSLQDLDLDALFENAMLEGELSQEQEIPPEVPPPPNIEEEIPTDTENVPAYYRNLTDKHPLGNLILRLTSSNAELARKLNMKNTDTPGLGEVCTKFVEALRLERNRAANKVNKATSEIEDNILQKELSYHQINAPIKPPQYFSATPVLTSAKKLQEAIKTFPTKSGQRFNGESDGVNILEFLTSLNTAQEIMQLTKKEFLQIMLKCVSGKVYNLIGECISYEHDISDLYHSLLTLYDKRLTSANARKMLMAYKASRNDTLTKVQSQIIEYASRVAAQIPVGSSRTSMFNIEACNALIRALPHNSATVVTNVMNSLAAKLRQAPSFVQLIKSLTQYADTINLDIQRNGVLPGRSNQTNNNGYAKYGRQGFKVYAISGQGYKNRAYSQNGANRRTNRNQATRRSNKGRYESRRGSFSRRNNVRSISQTENKYYDSPKQEKVYNMNRGKFVKRSSEPGSSEKPFKGKYCTLCGSRTHSAEDICYKMRDSNNRVIETVPCFTACEICLKHDGKKLYHPSELCFNRDKSKDKKNKSD